MSLRMRSPEALGLTLAVGNPKEKTTLRVERLKLARSGDFAWKETWQEFGTYLRMFPVSDICRCGHGQRNEDGWIHIPDPLPQDRACQLCDCPEYDPPKSKLDGVQKAAARIRTVAHRAYRGTAMPRPSQWGRIEDDMLKVYRWIKTREAV